MVIVGTSPQSCGVATYPPGATFGLRLLHDYEFVWMIEGGAAYTDGEHNLTLPSGSILLGQPGANQFFRWDPNTRTRHAYIHFTLVTPISDLTSLQQWPLMRMLPEGDLLRPMFRHFLEWHDRQHESLNDLAIIQMVALFVNGHLGTNMFEDRAWPDGVERALAYIHNALEQDPSAKISTADIATFIFVSQPHLCRLFRAHLGNTPADIVRFAKLDIATGLLVRSNYKISEISDHCGFANQYHFARIFKQAYGRTPSEVRLSSKSGRGVPLSRLVSLSAKTPSD